MQGDKVIPTDLFEFAYVPDWYEQLDELAEMILPESWRFKKPTSETKNIDTPILERYINSIFRKQSIDYNTSTDTLSAQGFFHIENERTCFHTGLYTQRYKAVYACFERNKKQNSTLKWYFIDFCDEVSSNLKYIHPLPNKPYFPAMKNGVNFIPEWPIRVNVDHILGDAENLERIPSRIQKAKNLPLLLETAVELARRKAVVEPGLVVPQGYQNRLQHLIPIYLTNMKKPDLAMTLSVMDGYYLGNTCLTLEMAYLNARMIARPTAGWLADLVK